MKRISTSLVSGLLAALVTTGMTSESRAQNPYGQTALPRVAVFGGEAGYYGFGGHASTFQEGVLRGEADLLRAQGEASLNSAEALRSYEAAVDHALDNRVKTLAVRQKRQLMARMHQAELQRIELSQKAEARAARLQSVAETEAALSPADKAEKRERLAAGKLDLARKLQQSGRGQQAQKWFDEIVRDYPETAAAREVSLSVAGN
ncbi:MAG: hypothetical protein U0992_13095 [Planctomycetaceae bacterium]